MSATRSTRPGVGPDARPDAEAPAGRRAREVRVEGLGHRFPGTPMLFEDLDLRLSPGEVVGLCGPSGCGKSTLLSILAGWETPTAGTLTKIGIERTGWVFQNPYGVPRRSALDHVAFPLVARGQTRRAASAEALGVLRMFDLEHAADRPFSALSGGEAQRLMLARAVCTAPDLLLVDEPTAQLDTRTAATVNATLGNIAAGGSIVVIATHDPDTRAACDRVVDLVRLVHDPVVGQP
ncbi:ATP-binding cassette domain-containing protein [Cellulosimicrobium sp. SH8]|uniref:ATP-binding cassette domain-containing protein n=1 Tax=Cellulosimicrobium sp. SH8 TaxID=2952936 RepID=UPI0021F280DB|nr:ATP-binding cassette domain-containing protein [Cellulosimicrobium sp. SH8]